ncbi:beta carbonic anhydrase [Burkholderia pseudomallei]|nr:beta carbonic anhydrase [Burkholderia pseudomallei]
MNKNDHPLSHLFDNNDAWVKRKLADDPQYFFLKIRAAFPGIPR